MRQPAHDWRENNRRKVLRRVKDRYRRSLSCAGNRGGLYGCCRGTMALPLSPPEAEGKERNDNAEAAKDIHEAL